MTGPRTITALIVDDEPLARERIRDLLDEMPGIDVVGEAAGGREAIAKMESLGPDLVFLDIEMPDLDGFGVLEAIDPARLPAVVFVTAYDAYAIRAFEIHAVDYVLKPIVPERFGQAVERAVAAIAGPARHRVERLLVDRMHRNAGPQRLAVKSDERLLLLDPAQIDWIESDGKHARLHVGAQVLPIRRTMTYLAERLRSAGFIRIHRSTIVNAARIRELEPWFHGELVVVLRDGTKLRSSAAHSADLHRLVRNTL